MKTNKINRLLLALCVAGLVNVSFAEEPAVEAAPEAAAPVQQVVPFAQVSGLIDARIGEQVNNLNTQIQEVKTEITAAVAANTAAIEEMKAAQEAKKTKKAKKSDDGEDEKNLLIGVRGAFGVSAFNGHKAIRLAPISAPAFDVDGIHAIQLGSGVSAGGGLAAQYGINDLISVALEMQYNVYRARGNAGIRVEEADFGRMHEVRVELHTLDIPVMARFSFLDGLLFAEVGPQFGANLYGKIEVNTSCAEYSMNELRHPFLNRFAFGPAVGFGMKQGNALLGLRFNYNVIEYAENSNGNPWAMHFGITLFPFGF